MPVKPRPEVSTENCLEEEGEAAKPGRKGGIRGREKSLHALERQIDTNPSQCFYCREWLSAETENNNNCLLVASTQTPSIQEYETAFQPRCWLARGKTEASTRQISLSAPAQKKKKKKKKGISQAAGLTACWSVLQHSTEHFHPAYILLTAPFPSRGGNASSGPQIALVNWCWIPAVQQDKPTTVNRQSLPFGKAKTVNLFQLLHFLLSFHCEIKQYLEPWFLYNLENHLDKAMLW